MAGRIRTLKPEWLENQRLVSCSNEARVLSAGLILLADDYGRGRSSIGYLAGQVWPESDKGRAMATKSLDELARIRYVLLYEVNCQSYYCLPGWPRHQVVKNPGKPRVPPPSEEDLRRLYGDSTETLTPDHDLDHRSHMDEEKRRSRTLPPDWTPKEAHQLKAAELALNLKHETERFQNWAIAKGQSYVDWDAAFRNWLTNDKYRGGTRKQPKANLASLFDKEAP